MAGRARQWPSQTTETALPQKIAGIERVHITLPTDIVEELKRLAHEEDRSLSAEAARQLRKALRLPTPRGQQR